MMEERVKIKEENLAHCSRSIYDLWETQEGNPTPDTFKIGREVSLQLEKVERTLFTEIEEKESGSYIVSGLSSKVSEMDFEAFELAVGQILYNQSYQSGNTETNSGLTKTETKIKKEPTEHTYYRGEIITTLKDLCRYAYGGEPTKDDREAMTTLIDTLHSIPVEITFPNGDKSDTYLCVKMGKYTRKRDGAITYHLALNPIFCENVRRNFSEFPQDITRRLTAVAERKTKAHYKLLQLLGRQDKRKPFILYIDTIIEKLGLIKAYKKDAGKTERQLGEYFEDMVKIGLLKDFQTETYTRRGKQRITKVTFILNPNFTKKPEQASEVGD